MKQSKAESLILHIAQNPDTGLRDGSLMKLLEEYFAGAAVQTLIPLLVSEDERVVAEASWVASELSSRVMDIWDDLLQLIDHPSEKARFWIVLCIMSRLHENFNSNRMVGNLVIKACDREDELCAR